MVHAEHNHPLSENLVSHPGARKLTDDQRQLILDLISMGMRPAAIKRMLEECNSELLINTHDIHNLRTQAHKMKMANHDSLQSYKTIRTVGICKARGNLYKKATLLRSIRVANIKS